MVVMVKQGQFKERVGFLHKCLTHKVGALTMMKL